MSPRLAPRGSGPGRPGALQQVLGLVQPPLPDAQLGEPHEREDTLRQ